MLLKMVANSIDSCSLSNLDEVETEHIEFDLTVDFQNKLLRGSVVLHLKKKKDFKQVILDRYFLNISKITLLETGSVLKVGYQFYIQYNFAPFDELFGHALTIDLNSKDVKSEFKIKIDYETTDKCTALQWLTPE